jgi:ABC-type thiamine transport system ATPase subunit
MNSRLINGNYPPHQHDNHAAYVAPFPFDLHVSDLGHALVYGPTGAGKSTFLDMLALQRLHTGRVRRARQTQKV